MKSGCFVSGFLYYGSHFTLCVAFSGFWIPRHLAIMAKDLIHEKFSKILPFFKIAVLVEIN